MKTYKDQMNRTVRCNDQPQRIVSLVPSQTELLFDLGLEDRVIGITKFCIHPKEWHQSKTRVGGTKNVDIEKVKSLQPDLIIANKEENTKKDIEALAELYPVWVSDIISIDDAIGMIRGIGQVTNTALKANTIADQIKNSLTTPLDSTGKSCMYSIWKDPWMFAGQNVFINEMLGFLGVDNLLNDSEVLDSINTHSTRYPAIQEKSFNNLKPDIIFLSSEPYPFKEKHIEVLKMHFPTTEILLVDGEMFTWYGSRLLMAPKYLKELHETIQK